MSARYARDHFTMVNGIRSFLYISCDYFDIECSLRLIMYRLAVWVSNVDSGRWLVYFTCIRLKRPISLSAQCML